MILKIDDDTRSAVRALADRLDEVPDGALVAVDTDGGALRVIVLAAELAAGVAQVAEGERFKATPLAVRDRPTGPPGERPPAPDRRPLRSVIATGDQGAPDHGRRPGPAQEAPGSPETPAPVRPGRGGPPDPV